jgi:hypothetical protein
LELEKIMSGTGRYYIWMTRIKKISGEEKE